MKEEWNTYRLLDICDVYQPSTISKKELVASGQYDVYGANGIIGKYDKYNHEESEVLLGCRGACGCINVSSPHSWINGNAMVVHPRTSELSKAYLVYLLRTLDYTQVITGTAQPQITRTSLSNVKIPVPPLSEQEKIVSFFDAEFAKIDALKANTEQQLQAAKDLFQSAIKEYFTPKEGWKKIKLSELSTKIGSGATPKGGRKIYIDKGCSLIRSMNVRYGEFKYDELAHISEEAAGKLKGVTICKDDVLFNITGASIARCCVVPEDVIPARVNQHVSIIRIKEGRLNPYFLSYLLISPKHQKELLTIGEAGSTRQALTKEDLENHIVELPSLDEQNLILNRINTLSAKVKALQENYNKTLVLCNDLKQALLKSIFE